MSNHLIFKYINEIVMFFTIAYCSIVKAIMNSIFIESQTADKPGSVFMKHK